MRKTVNDLNAVKTVFIHVNEIDFLKEISEKIFDDVKIICVDKNYNQLKKLLKLNAKDNDIIPLSKYGNNYISGNYFGFSKNNFLSILAESYSSNDQSELKNSNLSMIDLLIIDLGEKDFFSFDIDDLASLFLLMTGLKNYSRVAVVSDAESFNFLEERISVNNEVNLKYKKEVITTLKDRFVLSQQACKKVSKTIKDFFDVKYFEEKDKLELLVKSKKEFV